MPKRTRLTLAIVAALAVVAVAVGLKPAVKPEPTLWHVRKRSADRLATLGTIGKPALPALTNLLADQESFVRDSAGNAIRALTSIAPAATAAASPP